MLIFAGLKMQAMLSGLKIQGNIAGLKKNQANLAVKKTANMAGLVSLFTG